LTEVSRCRLFGRRMAERSKRAQVEAGHTARRRLGPSTSISPAAFACWNLQVRSVHTIERFQPGSRA